MVRFCLCLCVCQQDYSKKLSMKFNDFFYRATLRKRGLCCRPVSVRLSVRSVKLVYCIKTAEDDVKLLSQPGSPIILVFLLPSAGTQFKGQPLLQRHKIHGVGKFCDFRRKSPFISETVRDRPWLLWNVER